MAWVSSDCPSPFAPNVSTGYAPGRAPTKIAFELPVIFDEEISVAVIVWLPLLINVAENVPCPDFNGALAGSCARGSLLVKCAVPAYVGTGLFEASKAPT